MFKKYLPLLAAFLMGAIIPMIVLFGIITTSSWGWRTIQTLRKYDAPSSSSVYSVNQYELQKRDFIDTRFRIKVDGSTIYTSADFGTVHPIREGIALNVDGSILVFIAAEQILFAYNLATKESLSPDEFSALVIPRHGLAELRYEGDPSRVKPVRYSDSNPITIPSAASSAAH